MDAFLVTGGNCLRGEIDVAGSKNTALAVLSTVVLTEGTTILHNVPDVSDTRIKTKLLERFGADVHWREGSVYIDCSTCRMGEIDEEMVRSIRTSFYLLGPLLARTGEVTLPAPGGCKIGARPVDFHLKGLRAMGAEIDLTGGVYHVKADHLTGCEIYFDFPSAGATQHLMATATLAKGITVIKNAAMEPEVVFLAAFLNGMGARIEGAGTSTITIQGVSELSGSEFRIPADRMQAGTYLLAGAITQGSVKVKGILPDDQAAVVSKLREAGAEIEEGPDWIRATADGRLKGIKVKTMPHPGFPTDMQQPMAAVLTLAEGTSVVEESVYESRIGHIQELNRMGADIRLEGSRSAIIKGVESLRGSVVEASDLRAGAALVVAGLAAEGETVVKNIHWVDRGYERLEETITSLGGTIERIRMQDLDTRVSEAEA
jgi:UDP-N-acetylglucosamine 1-carboxyvinyltransferase